MTRVKRLMLAITLLGIMGILPSTTALAGQTVDPGTLHPPPFAPDATCTADGTSIICTADSTFTDTNLDVGPVCQAYGPSNTFDVIVNDAGRLHWTWRYTASGNLVEFISQFQVHEMDVNAATGRTGKQDTGRTLTITYDGAGNELSDRYTGNVLTATVQGSGVTFHDVGLATFLPDQLIIHGPHDLLQMGNDSVYAAYCAALAA